jgi:hypothetical protein
VENRGSDPNDSGGTPAAEGVVPGMNFCVVKGVPSESSIGLLGL